jgi:hypothetical protein
MATKYFRKAFDYIRANPTDYIVTRFAKMWSMWQKPNIFFYTEPGFDRHWKITFSANIILLGLAVWGILKSLKLDDVKARKSIYLMISFIIFMTVAIAFSHAEPRLTIPAYPLLFLFAAVGINSGISTLFRHRNI